MAHCNSPGKRSSGLLGNDGDGNTASDGPYVVTVHGVSGAFVLEPEDMNRS